MKIHAQSSQFQLEIKLVVGNRFAYHQLAREPSGPTVQVSGIILGTGAVSTASREVNLPETIGKVN